VFIEPATSIAMAQVVRIVILECLLVHAVIAPSKWSRVGQSTGNGKKKTASFVGGRVFDFPKDKVVTSQALLMKR
jgi:hypothetical protein